VHTSLVHVKCPFVLPEMKTIPRLFSQDSQRQKQSVRGTKRRLLQIARVNLGKITESIVRFPLVIRFVFVRDDPPAAAGRIGECKDEKDGSDRWCAIAAKKRFKGEDSHIPETLSELGPTEISAFPCCFRHVRPRYNFIFVASSLLGGAYLSHRACTYTYILREKT